jgi:hypothetical protein
MIYNSELNLVWRIVLDYDLKTENWYVLKDKFSELEGILRQKYIFKSELKNFLYPYEEGDGPEMTAISLDKYFYYTIWHRRWNCYYKN